VDKPRNCAYKPAHGDRLGWSALLPLAKAQNSTTDDTFEGRFRLQVVVRDNNVDQALRALKKKLQREGVFREMKLRNYYEKPSEKKARQKAEAIRRARKLARKRAQRESGLPATPAAGAATARPARPERM
jgi:small subunit ribosomal protein S21